MIHFMKRKSHPHNLKDVIVVSPIIKYSFITTSLILFIAIPSKAFSSLIYNSYTQRSDIYHIRSSSNNHHNDRPLGITRTTRTRSSRLSSMNPLNDWNADTNTKGNETFISVPSLEPSPPVSDNYFLKNYQSTKGTVYDDENLLNSYLQVMKEVLVSRRVNSKKKNDSDFQIVSDFLHASAPLISIDAYPTIHENAYNKDDSDDRRTVYLTQLQSQQQLFKDTFLTTHYQIDLMTKVLTYIGDYCAKHKLSKPLYVAFYKMKEIGMIPRENTLSTYLYALSSSSSSSSSNEDHYVSNDDKNESFVATHTNVTNDITEEIATLHDGLYQPTENTVSIRIKTLVEKGDNMKAEELLNTLSNSNQNDYSGTQRKSSQDQILKLRTCLPLLILYAQRKDVSSALKLYHRMKVTPSVYLEPETYSRLLSLVASEGYFRQDSSPIPNSQSLGYSPGFGPLLLDRLMQDMCDDILEINNGCVHEIRNAFAKGFKDLAIASNLHEIPFDCQLAPLNRLADEDEVVVCRVTVDHMSAICPRTGVKLKIIPLDKEQKHRMHDTLLDMADSQFEAYDAKLEARNRKPKNVEYDSNFAKNELGKFADWLNEREGKPFTAIVDGANVAYFGLGTVNYHQVKLMVNTLTSMGEYPLVVMPQKYVQEKFYLRKGFVQELTESQKKIMEELKESNQMYIVSSRCLDDYYWMLSSVSEQTKSSAGMSLDVLPNNEEKRCPGVRPMLITNDQMRDHKLELLEPRLFRRWFSCHIVNYNFAPFVTDSYEDREISFSTADLFSREIQGNNNKSSMVWHIPVTEWDKNDRFCLCVPQSD